MAGCTLLGLVLCYCIICWMAFSILVVLAEAPWFGDDGQIATVLISPYLVPVVTLTILILFVATLDMRAVINYTYQQLQAWVQYLSADDRKLNARLTAVENQLAAMNPRVNVMSKAMDDLAAAVSGLSAEIGNVVSSMKSTIASLNDEIASLKANANVTAEDTAGIETQVKTLNDQTAALHSILNPEPAPAPAEITTTPAEPNTPASGS